MNVIASGLELSGINHSYGKAQIIKNFNLAVPTGSLTCLLGPSGCGKTTVLRLAAGLEDLQGGSIKIKGRLVASETRTLLPEKRDIGLMFQEHALFPHLTVLENVLFGIGRQAVNSRGSTAKMVLQQVDMVAFKDSYPHMLSGGEQQRVALARALAARPGVMLLDEPFSGLDVALRANVREDTMRILKDSLLTTLMVTHDPVEAMMMADHIALMDGGTIVQTGRPSELYRHPGSPFCARFLGEVLEFRGVVDHGMVKTPLGLVPAAARQDGEKMVVLIRPEALYFQNEIADTSVLIKILEIRDLGALSKIIFEVEENGVELQVNVPARELPKVGSKVMVNLDLAMVFVFPVRYG